MPTFTETETDHESRGLKWWQIMKSWNHEVSVKVADRNHESWGHKPSPHVEMFATKSMTSSRQTHLCCSREFSPLQY